MSDESDIQAAIVAGMQLATPRHQQGYKPYAIVPHNATLEELALEPEHPPRIIASPVFHDAPSFIAYMKAYKTLADTEARIFANVDDSQVVAIIDYHNINGVAHYGSHRATFTARESEEWKIWMAINGKKLTQLQFAEFLENNSRDILTPDAATMLEIASSLHVSKGVTFKSAKRLSDGQVQMTYAEEIDGKAGARGDLIVPQVFTIGLRPYLGTSMHRIDARLRYRLEDGHLGLWYDLHRPKEIQRDAFDAMLKRIGIETQLQVLLGTP